MKYLLWLSGLHHIFTSNLFPLFQVPKRALSKSIWLIFLVIPLTGQAQFDEYRYSHPFSSEACLEDLNFFRNKLEQEHPNLYLYTPKKNLDLLFDSLRISMGVQTNSINFYNQLTLLLPVIKDGHTHIFPDPATIEDNNKHASFWPMQIHWEGNRLFVLKEYSATQHVSPGTEILLINGSNVSFLYEIMMRRQIRDGYSLSYPRWIIERFFTEYFSYHFGNPSTFYLHTVNTDNTFGEIIINALPKDSIAYYRDTLNSQLTTHDSQEKGLMLAMDTPNRTATMTIRDFHHEILRKEYNQKFEEVIPSLFRQVQENHIDYVVLDLRDNQGGDIENAVLLLSHLLDTAFQVVRSYASVDPATAHLPEARLQPEKGPALGYQKPQENPFRGKLFVLINGGTFSASSIVCSALQEHHRCLFIGEETGGNSVVMAGGGKYVELPNTKTKVLIPTLRYNIKSILYNIGRGIVPDYPISPTMKDLLAHRDPLLDLAFQLIKADRKP